MRRALSGWVGVLVIACSDPAPVPATAPSPAPAPPSSVAPPPTTAVDAPERTPRLTIGTGHFFSPGAVRAIVPYEGRIYVARDGERIEVWTRDGALEATFTVTEPPPPGGLGTGIGAIGGITGLDVRGDRIAIALGGHGARVLARSDGHEIFAVRDLDVVHGVALLEGGALASAHGGEAYANGDMVIEAHGACGLCLWSPTGERTATIAPTDAGGWVTSLTAASEGATIVTGASDGRLRVYDARATLVREIRTGDRRIEHVALGEGGDTLLYADDVGGVARVGLDGTGRRGLFAGDEIVQAAALGDARIAWASRLGALRFLDGAGARVAAVHLDGVSALALDGDDVLVGDTTGHVRRWHDGAFASPEDPGRAVEQVLYDDTGERLIVRAGTELRVFRGGDGGLASGPRTLPDFTCAIALRAGGRLLVQRNAISLSEEDLDGGGHARSAGSGGGSSINHLDVSPRGDVLAYATYDRIHVGSTSAREPDGVRALALSDDGASLAFTTQGATPRLVVIDAATGTSRWTVPLATIGATLAWRRDRIAVVLAEGGGIQIRGAADGAVQHEIARDPDAATVGALELSPDAGVLAIASDDGVVRVVDASSGEARWQVSAHRGAVRSLAFRPDGSEFASAGADGTVRVWRVAD